MPITPLLILDENQIRAVLTYADLVPAMRHALADFSAGRAVQPVRTILPVAADSGWFGAMPAVYGDVLGAKLVTFFPGNAASGLNTHHAIIQLFRASTGEPLVTMDGRLITEMRTAAVSAVAADLLTLKQPLTLAILGSGVQARSHIAALSHVREFSEVRIWSRNFANASALAEEFGAQAAATAEQAVTGADLVITVTSTTQPVLLGRWLKPTAVVCAVGSCTPDRRELDDNAMRGTILVESRDAALRESGDILHSCATIHAELGDVLNGTATLPHSTYPTVFKSVGIAIADIASAKLVYGHFTQQR